MAISLSRKGFFAIRQCPLLSIYLYMSVFIILFPRELYLILDPRETIMSIEHYAATLVSHELAHKWFGNLITCFWWSETWINEGFASYFGYIATAEVSRWFSGLLATKEIVNVLKK